MTRTRNDLSPYQKRVLIERALREREHSAVELSRLVGVTVRTANRIIIELTPIFPLTENKGKYRIGRIIQ